MRHHIAAVGVALLLTPALSAQMDSVTTWPIGSRVRVWTASNRNVTGELTELRGDTLVIIGRGRSQAKVLADSTVRLDVSDGRGPSDKYIVGGALAGAALGVGAMALLNAPACIPGECRGTTAHYAPGALIGAVVGGVAGAIKRFDRWKEVRVPGRVSLVPSARQTAVMLSFTFR
jgi:hypothetical protein